MITCRLPMRCARPGTINHGRTTPALKDDKSNPSRLHQRGTSVDSDRVSRACSTLRGYDVKAPAFTVRSARNALTSRLIRQRASMSFPTFLCIYTTPAPIQVNHVADIPVPRSNCPVLVFQACNALFSVAYPFKAWSIVMRGHSVHSQPPAPVALHQHSVMNRFSSQGGYRS